MSFLNKILNDAPPPQSQSYVASSRSVPADMAARDIPSPARLTAESTSRSNDHFSGDGASMRDQRDLRNVSNWDEYPATLSAPMSGLRGPGAMRLDEQPPPIPGYMDNGHPSKRRRTQSAMSPQDAPGRGGIPFRPINYSSNYKSEEERLASSDLDDCEEVWKQEMDVYAAETRRRYRRLEEVFEQSNRVRVFKWCRSTELNRIRRKRQRTQLCGFPIITTRE